MVGKGGFTKGRKARSNVQSEHLPNDKHVNSYLHKTNNNLAYSQTFVQLSSKVSGKVISSVRT